VLAELGEDWSFIKMSNLCFPACSGVCFPDEAFNRTGLSQLIDTELGIRSVLYGYYWKNEPNKNEFAKETYFLYIWQTIKITYY